MLNPYETKTLFEWNLWSKWKKSGISELFFRSFFQPLKLKAHYKDNKNVTHLYPQFTYIIFIYSYSYILTIIGYMTNSQLTIYPCCLVAQWIEHCTGITLGHGFESRSSLKFFLGCLCNCLSWKYTARITNFTHVYLQFTYMIFFIHIHSYSLSSGIWRHHNWPCIHVAWQLSG